MNLKAPLKEVLRKKLLRRRLALEVEKVEVISAMISASLIRQAFVKIAKGFLLYLPVRNEIETKFLIAYLLENKKRIFLPAYDGRNWCISAYNEDDKLIKGKYDILQPARIRKASPGEIDLAFLPGLAFSKNGVRVGYGKGVYDKLLEKSNCIKIGLAYHFQVVDNLGSKPHDVLMDLIATEKGIFFPNS